MPKAKRRNPIVPIPKAAEFHQAKSCGASKSHVNGDKPKSDDGAREHHAKGHSGGGRAAKRARSDAANSDGAQASKRPRSSGGSDASAGRGPRSGAPRRPQQQDPRQRPHKQGRPEGSASQHHPRHHHHSQQQPQHQWTPVSQVHQQAATAVGRLLEADASRRHGASLKSLTLAPHIVAKKATYAVTCQVLKCGCKAVGGGLWRLGSYGRLGRCRRLDLGRGSTCCGQWLEGGGGAGGNAWGHWGMGPAYRATGAVCM